MDAQAGLRLCCGQTPKDRFSRAETHTISRIALKNMIASTKFLMDIGWWLTIDQVKGLIGYVGAEVLGRWMDGQEVGWVDGWVDGLMDG